MNPDFRFALKQGTRESHECVDSLFSQLNFQHLDDYQRFLRVHAQCFGVLETHAGQDCLTQPLLGEMNASLKMDLLAAQMPLPASTEPALSQAPDPLAIDYIVSGSRLGSQVLAGRWRESADPTVRLAGRYLNLPHNPDVWRAVCARLSDVSPDTARAARIVRDVNDVFELFVASWRAYEASEMAEGLAQ